MKRMAQTVAPASSTTCSRHSPSFQNCISDAAREGYPVSLKLEREAERGVQDDLVDERPQAATFCFWPAFYGQCPASSSIFSKTKLDADRLFLPSEMIARAEAPRTAIDMVREAVPSDRAELVIAVRDQYGKHLFGVQAR